MEYLVYTVHLLADLYTHWLDAEQYTLNTDLHCTLYYLVYTVHCVTNISLSPQLLLYGASKKNYSIVPNLKPNRIILSFTITPNLFTF